MTKRKALSPSELKDFRHKVGLAKKKGLISKIDARSARPEMMRQGNRLDKLVAKFDDVISGKAGAVEVSDKQLRQYRKSGYETIGKRVIIPHSATEKASITRKGYIQVKESKSGIKRVELPIPFHNLEQFVRDGEAQGRVLDNLKGGRKYWAYKFNGFNSYSTYERLDLLFSELSEGTASGLNLMEIAHEATPRQQKEVYQNLTFFAIPDYSSWPTRNIGKQSRPSAQARKRYRRRIKNTLAGERQRVQDAAAHKQWRSKLSGAELEKYKRKARKRAKKARAKRK